MVQLKLARDTAPPTRSAEYEAAIAKYQALTVEQAKKKEELRAQADADQARYDALNNRDDQFDLSDALIAIAIALLAVTALTGLWSLYWVSLVPAASGVIMGIAGLASLPIHPDALVRLLS